MKPPASTCARQEPSNAARGHIGSPVTSWSDKSQRCSFASRADNSRLAKQVGPTLDRWPDRSRSLRYILDPGRIYDHVVDREPNVGVGKIVIDPIAVVVDVGLCELHAGKRYARGRHSQLLTRPHFLHLHSSGGNSGNLAVVHFGKDIGFFSSRMDLVFAILFDSFAKKVFSVKMVFLLREGDARRVDRGSCRDHSEYETPINHELAPFGNGSTPTTSSGFPASIATKSALSFVD